MSIEAKHAYRFGYMKSEQWSNVRIEALAREKGKCQICFEESIHNDAHHIWYPERFYETKQEQLVVVCRACHDFLHVVMSECKTGDEEFGRAQWLKFSQAMTVWRMQKQFLFDDGQSVDLGIIASDGPKELRAYLVKLSTQLKDALSNGGAIPTTDQKEFVKKQKLKDVNEVCELIKKWAKGYDKSANCVTLSVAESDFEI